MKIKDKVKNIKIYGKWKTNEFFRIEQKEQSAYHKKPKGFTLIEVLVAVLVITIGMWLMMNVFILSSDGISAARRRITALNYAQQVMEDYIIDSDFDDSNLNASGGSKTSNSVDTVDNFTRSYDVWYVTSGNLYNISGSQTDYKRIQVIVSDDNGNIGDVTLDTLKTDFQDLE